MRVVIIYLLFISTFSYLSAATTLSPSIAMPTVQDTDLLEMDEWYIGHMNGQAMANMHAITVRHEDGTRTSTSQSTIVINRKMLGQRIVISIKESGIYRENNSGGLTGFQLMQEEQGSRTVAVGHIHPEHIAVTVHKGATSQSYQIPLKPDMVIHGQQGMQKALINQLQDIGTDYTYYNVALMQGRVHLLTVRARLVKKLAHGGADYTMVIEQMPGFPIKGSIDHLGNLKSMHMNMGPLNIQFLPADKPAILGDAVLGMMQLITHKGPRPQSGAINRYRLNEKIYANIPEDNFQTKVNGIIEVRSQGGTSILEDPQVYLQPEVQLEIESPELIAWTEKILRGKENATIAEKAEALRQAVRTYLRGDLSRADLSALEAFQLGSGDCTEYANLLAATLRIAGIPSRVDVGFVYAMALGGWGGHAWNSAYDAEQGRWIHLDAAYPGVVRSCYIRSGSTSGKNIGANNLLDNVLSFSGGFP